MLFLRSRSLIRLVLVIFFLNNLIVFQAKPIAATALPALYTIGAQAMQFITTAATFIVGAYCATHSSSTKKIIPSETILLSPAQHAPEYRPQAISLAAEIPKNNYVAAIPSSVPTTQDTVIVTAIATQAKVHGLSHKDEEIILHHINPAPISQKQYLTCRQLPSPEPIIRWSYNDTSMTAHIGEQAYARLSWKDRSTSYVRDELDKRSWNAVANRIAHQRIPGYAQMVYHQMNCAFTIIGNALNHTSFTRCVLTRLSLNNLFVTEPYDTNLQQTLYHLNSLFFHKDGSLATVDTTTIDQVTCLAQFMLSYGSAKQTVNALQKDLKLSCVQEAVQRARQQPSFKESFKKFFSIPKPHCFREQMGPLVAHNQYNNALYRLIQLCNKEHFDAAAYIVQTLNNDYNALMIFKEQYDRYYKRTFNSHGILQCYEHDPAWALLPEQTKQELIKINGGAKYINTYLKARAELHEQLSQSWNITSQQARTALYEILDLRGYACIKKLNELCNDPHLFASFCYPNGTLKIFKTQQLVMPTCIVKEQYKIERAHLNYFLLLQQEATTEQAKINCIKGIEYIRAAIESCDNERLQLQQQYQTIYRTLADVTWQPKEPEQQESISLEKIKKSGYGPGIWPEKETKLPTPTPQEQYEKNKPPITCGSQFQNPEIKKIIRPPEPPEEHLPKWRCNHGRNPTGLKDEKQEAPPIQQPETQEENNRSPGQDGSLDEEDDDPDGVSIDPARHDEVDDVIITIATQDDITSISADEAQELEEELIDLQKFCTEKCKNIIDGEKGLHKKDIVGYLQSRGFSIDQQETKSPVFTESESIQKRKKYWLKILDTKNNGARCQAHSRLTYGGKHRELDLGELQEIFSKPQDWEKLAKVFDGTVKITLKSGEKVSVWIDYEHIFNPIIIVNCKKGEITLNGFHHDWQKRIEKSRLIQFSDYKEESNGIYKADWIFNGEFKESTFFPAAWSRVKVIEKIIEAIKNPNIDDGDKNKPEEIEKDDNRLEIRGKTSEGIDIIIIFKVQKNLDNRKLAKLVTAYPNIKSNKK